MITALSTPGRGRLLLDGNTTRIKIQSTNGEGYYFRAKIFINDALFDEQGWSRSDAFTATKDIRKLYQAYFAPGLPALTSLTLTEQTHLTRKVDILIEEYSHATGQLTATLQLPVFYIMYNILPETFSDGAALRILGVDVDNLVLPVTGKIALPVYANSTGQTLKISLTTDQGTEINNKTVTVTGKKVYLYAYNLGGYALGSSIPYLKLTVSLGTTTLTKNIRLLHNPAYTPKEIAFRNNFGFYLYAYPFGEQQIETAYDIQGYDTNNGNQEVGEINQEDTYTINSGAYRSSEKAIIEMIAASPDVKLNLPTGSGFRLRSGWLDLFPKTKKHTSFIDRQHNYSEKLQFSIQKSSAIDNTGFVSVTASHPDIEILDTTVTGNSITIAYALNNGFTTNNLRLQYRMAGSTAWYVIGDVLSNGSVTFTRATGSYSARIVDYNNLTNVSNTVNFTVA